MTKPSITAMYSQADIGGKAAQTVVAGGIFCPFI